MHTKTTDKLGNNLPACTDFADAFFYHLDRRCLQRRLMPQRWGKTIERSESRQLMLQLSPSSGDTVQSVIQNGGWQRA